MADFITAAMLRLRRKQDGMPHNRTSPGRNTGAVSRNPCREGTVSSDRAKAAKQDSVDFVFCEVCAFLSGRTAELQQIDIEIGETPPHPHFCTGHFGNT
jgi:hypothetical protein